MRQSFRPARITSIVRLCAAQRQVAHAGQMAAQIAFDRAEVVRRADAEQRDAAFDLWNDIATSPIIGPEIVAHAGYLLVARERALSDSKQQSEDMRLGLDRTREALAEAGARSDVAEVLRKHVYREQDKRRDEHHAAETEDRLLHRRTR